MPATAGTITSLTDLAQTVLNISAAALAETPAGTPDLVYMDAGPLPAWDCAPALFVVVSGLSEELTSPLSPAGVTGQRASFGRINEASIITTVLRCAATPDSNGNVTAAAKTAVASVVQTDGWALWTGIYRAILSGAFEDKCSIVHFDTAEALEEQGNFVGWQQVLRVELGGIRV